MTLVIERLDPLDDAAGIPWHPSGPGDGEEVAMRAAVQGIPTWLVLIDGVAVGACGLHDVIGDEEPRAVEIGYGLVAAARGRGLGAQVVGSLLEELRALDVDVVTAEVELDSHDAASASASQAILRGLGFDDLGEVVYPSGRSRRFALSL